MLTTKRYINLLVFHFLTQTWYTNSSDYTLDKFNLLFTKIPDKITMDEINKNDYFIRNLNDYKAKWNKHILSDEMIKILYFCFRITGNNNIDYQYHIDIFYFSFFVKIYNDFYHSYDSIVEENMMFLLHENLRIEIRDYLNENTERFKYLFIREKLTKYKQNV